MTEPSDFLRQNFLIPIHIPVFISSSDQLIGSVFRVPCSMVRFILQTFFVYNPILESLSPDFFNRYPLIAIEELRIPVEYKHLITYIFLRYSCTCKK